MSKIEIIGLMLFGIVICSAFMGYIIASAKDLPTKQYQARVFAGLWSTAPIIILYLAILAKIQLP